MGPMNDSAKKQDVILYSRLTWLCRTCLLQAVHRLVGIHPNTAVSGRRRVRLLLAVLYTCRTRLLTAVPTQNPIPEPTQGYSRITELKQGTGILPRTHSAYPKGESRSY